MGDHQVAVPKDEGLVHPSLDVDVSRLCSQGVRVAVAADGHQDPHRQLAECSHRTAQRG